ERSCSPAGEDTPPHHSSAVGRAVSVRYECITTRKGKPSMYAIVKSGGKQYKVAVGDLVKVEKIEAEPGAPVDLPVALIVDGANLTTDADALGKASVSSEIVEHTKGQKIRIHKFHNKKRY